MDENNFHIYNQTLKKKKKKIFIKVTLPIQVTISINLILPCKETSGFITLQNQEEKSIATKMSKHSNIYIMKKIIIHPILVLFIIKMNFKKSKTNIIYNKIPPLTIIEKKLLI